MSKEGGPALPQCKLRTLGVVYGETFCATPRDIEPPWPGVRHVTKRHSTTWTSLTRTVEENVTGPWVTANDG